ncbi:predicted protein [Uncinocarpus reesii 1704]|uniref:Reverse transcriptase domain-containing protein n=1 Tax=Uncinocarpus reesii (strain UAMH 1704) TaxID=336963 RepID=C4JNN7_UNCRE|nr:uncharacterized protein UREG_03035 [Uncinocarpus reesii 1704]EEP78190.1 predicted protein [Uncinocarpus reesii 1704]
MSFRLTNTPLLFQMMMNVVLIKYTGIFYLMYLNNIIVFLKFMKEHLKHLKKVFNKFHAHKLYIKMFKCIFLKNKLEYCGHIVRKEVI